MKSNPYTPGEFQLILDQAKHQASVLRDAAIDDFWRGANSMLARSFATAGRSTNRLRHALARRARRSPALEG